MSLCLSLCAAYSTQQQKVLTTILIDASTYKYTIIYTHRHSVRIYLYQETAHKRFSFKTMNRIDDLIMRWGRMEISIYTLERRDLTSWRSKNFHFLLLWPNRRTVETKHICFQSSLLYTLKSRGVYMSCPFDLTHSLAAVYKRWCHDCILKRVSLDWNQIETLEMASITSRQLMKGDWIDSIFEQ